MPKRLIAKVKSGLDGQSRQVAIAVGVFAGAFVVAALAAWASAIAVEARTTQAVRSKMIEADFLWVNVAADGLQLQLSGTAPNEAARFRAVNLAGSVIDASRVRDLLDVAPVKAIEAPTFSVEILRNDDGIQLIGLLPNGSAPKDLVSEAAALNAAMGVSDMLETANYNAPTGWTEAYAFGISAMKMLPRSKISIMADKVEIKAIADSLDQQRRLETELARQRPEGLATVIEISAPRPVLTPFTLRFVKDDQGSRFDACSADTERARDVIVSAGASAGVVGKSTCTIGLGVPSPSWSTAVVKGIEAVNALGSGTITFSDADVSLVANDTVSQASFDRVVGELQAGLPDVFSLTATLERKSDATAGPAEFTAALDPQGQVVLRGRLTDERLRDAVDSFAQAHFGVGKVQTLTRLDTDLPDGWPVRVLAGLEALGELAEGTLTVRSDSVEVKGVTGSQSASGRISQILSDKLGQGQTFRVNVRYDEALDPLAAIPTPQECAADIQAIVSKRKITFPPGSAEIDGTTSATMDLLADILLKCPPLRMEIAGHTDSQGSEGGNQALSQARAEAVELALQGRGVDVKLITAKGYGEADPIADNGTEEGREANRRIEFTLFESEQGEPSAANGAEMSAQAVDQTAAPAAEATDQGGDSLAGAVPKEETGPLGDEDNSPSVAPTEKTRRPLARPARDG